MASTIKVDEILDSQGNQFDGSQLGNVGKVLQVIERGWNSSTATTVSGYSDTTLMTQNITVKQNSRLVVFFCSGQTNNSGSTTNPVVRIKVDGVDIARAGGGATNHWFYGVDSRAVINLQCISGSLSQGEHTVTMTGGAYNGSVSFNYQDSNQGSLMIMEIGE